MNRTSINVAGVTGAAPAASAGTVTLGGDLVANRMGYGAMRLTGPVRRHRCPAGRKC